MRVEVETSHEMKKNDKTKQQHKQQQQSSAYGWNDDEVGECSG